MAEAPITANLAIFTTAAAAVWWSGSALATRADLIAERTGLGSLFAGALLLGVATSLPEIATTVSAALSGAGTLAGNNLLGGVAMQIAVLAVIDGVALRGLALTVFSPNASHLLHAVFLAMLLCVAAAGIVGPDYAIAGRLSVWSLALPIVYLLTLHYLRRYEGNPRWEPQGEVMEPPQSAVDMKDAVARRHEGRGDARIGIEFALSAAVVFVAGSVVAVEGEILADQTGLGQTFVGATLVAIATSLPELSTTFKAVRIGAYSMAVSNIMGTNALEVALLFPADLAYAEGSIFAALDAASVLLALIGIAVTLIYLWGVLERDDRTIAGFGVDSALVLATYAVGMLFFSMLSRS